MSSRYVYQRRRFLDGLAVKAPSQQNSHMNSQNVPPAAHHDQRTPLNKNRKSQLNNHSKQRPQGQVICQSNPTCSNNSISQNQHTKLTICSTRQAQRLDSQFVHTLQSIQSHFLKLTKHQQIRVQKWISKIIQNDQDLSWKINRNNYIKLLYHIIKATRMLRVEPFDKMPDFSKDLAYLSDYELRRKMKLIFDRMSSTFHLHKPNMIKIDYPLGDTCNVLTSIVNTARSQIQTSRKQNNPQVSHTNKSSDKINESKPKDEKYLHSISSNQCKPANDIRLPKINSQCPSTKRKKQERSGLLLVNQQAQIQLIPKSALQPNARQSQLISSVILSSMSSQVKQGGTLRSLPESQLLAKGLLHKKHINHQATMHKSQVICQRNYSSQRHQINICKQLVLLMAKLLLKHQLTVRGEGEYWQLMRRIHEYQQKQQELTEVPATKTAFNIKNRESSLFQQGSDKNDRKQGGRQSFSAFLSRMRQQIARQDCQDKDIKRQNYQQKTKVIIACSSLTNAYNPSSNSKHPQYTDKIYHQPYINHITQQSLDFKVEQGLQSSENLFYQLEYRPVTNSNQYRQTADGNPILVWRQMSQDHFYREEGQDQYRNIHSRLEEQDNSDTT